MKKVNLMVFLCCLIIFVENIGCKKETVKVTDQGSPVGTGNNPNKPPIALAGNEISIWWPVNSVKLNGTGSYDPDNDKITYKWIKNYGRDGITIEAPDSAITKVTNLEAGAYRFTLTV